ncbi:hypothetical protein NS14008_12095 [Nocardia seriolae]|nr:hypothetical protein NS14008_12095 [Nocardia seriolae]BAW08024.1 conserved hypothetical protein [Nocardia seriolae]
MLVPIATALVVGIVFLLVYLAAFHTPLPHRLPVAVAGTPEQAARIQSDLDNAQPGGYAVRAVADRASATDLLAVRSVYAAYLFDNSELLYAGANGPSVNSDLARALATGHDHLTRTDVLPATPGDSRGLSTFYTAFGVVLVGYLYALMAYHAAPRLPVAHRVAGLGLFSLACGVAAALIGGGAGFDALPAPVLGIIVVTGLMACAAASFTLVMMRLTGPLGPPLASIVLLILGNAGSGAILPAAYLPAWLHSCATLLPVGSGVRALQGMAYFHNDGLLTALLVLTVWTTACLGALLLKLGRPGPPRSSADIRPEPGNDSNPDR